MGSNKITSTDNIKPQTFVSSWNKHVLSWANNRLEVPKLILKYEDLVYKKDESVKLMMSFFEKNFNIKFDLADQKIANILETTSFNKLKSHEEKMDLLKLLQELLEKN